MQRLFIVKELFIGGNNFPSAWHRNAKKILSNIQQGDKIEEVFFALLKIIDTLDWQGACYPTSAVLYVLFREMGLNAKLCVGNVASINGCITHSWVEVNDEIYDAAIWRQNYTMFQNAPVIASKHINTREDVTVLYGVDWIPLEPRVYDFMDEPFERLMNCQTKPTNALTGFTGWDALLSISCYFNFPLPGDYRATVKKSKLLRKYKSLQMFHIKRHSADTHVAGSPFSVAENFFIGEWKTVIANRDGNHTILRFNEDGICTIDKKARRETFRWYIKDSSVVLTLTDDSIYAVFKEIEHEPKYKRVSIISFELGMFSTPAQYIVSEK